MVRPGGARPTGSARSKQARTARGRGIAAVAAFLVASALGISSSAGVARDGAAIVNSGSTNALGFKIEVWSDDSATAVLQNRAGSAQNVPKPFALGPAVVARFFADLKAARDGKATGIPCMKSASFGTTTRTWWHGWVSPDLDCPPNNALTAALVHDVGVIRLASRVDTTTPLRRGVLPPH